jgi:hypothetical protein
MRHDLLFRTEGTSIGPVRWALLRRHGGQGFSVHSGACTSNALTPHARYLIWPPIQSASLSDLAAARIRTLNPFAWEMASGASRALSSGSASSSPKGSARLVGTEKADVPSAWDDVWMGHLKCDFQEPHLLPLGSRPLRCRWRYGHRDNTGLDFTRSESHHSPCPKWTHFTSLPRHARLILILGREEKATRHVTCETDITLGCLHAMNKNGRASRGIVGMRRPVLPLPP